MYSSSNDPNVNNQQQNSMSTKEMMYFCCFGIICLILLIILSITGTANNIATEYAFFDGVKRLFSK